MLIIEVAERLALPTSDHGVAGLNPAEGEILPEPKRRFIAQSLSCSSFHCLEMTEILLKGCKTLTHPSIHAYSTSSSSRNRRFHIYVQKLLPPGAVTRLEACPLGMQAAPSSIPRPAHSFVETWSWKKFLWPFSLFRWFKKSSCQLLTKECALSTGKLPRRLAQEQCG